jgi:hypothetical protein
MSIVSTLKNPPLWSPAYNPIIWEVQSDQINQFKFRYVFDVYINDNTYLRYRIPANPAGAGLIDVSSLVQGALTVAQNLPFLSTTRFYDGDGLAARVYCKVGEEYAASVTSDPILYDGLGNVGAPAYGLYADGDWRPAPNNTTPVVAWASGQGANENYDYMLTSGEAILTYEMGLGDITPDTLGKFLTRCPYTPQTIRSDENFTLTWLNRNFETGVTGYVFPYAMKAEVSLDGAVVGHTDYIATEANGGVWPTCSTLPPLGTGASGPENMLYSFKINPADITSITKDQEVLFGPGNYGCSAQSIPDVFPDSHDTGLTPATNPSIIVLPIDDAFIQPNFNSNCTTGFGIGYTGSSELVYRNMQVKTGDVITIQIPSENTFGGSYPDMQLWGSVGGSNNPAHFEIIGTFTVSNSGGFNLYNITHTSTKNYTALGLRWFSATSVSCGKFGCFSNFWNITRAVLPADFDQICLSLYPWANEGTCALGATAMSEEICLTIDDTNCWGFEPIRFTWLNNLGGRDWYTFIKRNTYTQNATRDTFYQLPGYWSSAQWSIQDLNPSRWGTTVFKMQLNNNWTASTDWITEEQSEWLRSMFASPSVHVYLPGRSEPTLITITDANYSVQTFAREKLFQYFVSFVEAQPDVVQSY